ncbi:uncharacterized protein [Oryctolagus cuniculus]|uniref:uncharacterized protein n=1 Tax=Oryctolagus cuniculus TaxID=9986 RepID=UPI003879B198
MVPPPGPVGTRVSGTHGFGPVLPPLMPPGPPPARPLPAGSGRVHPCTEVPVELAKGSPKRSRLRRWRETLPGAAPERDAVQPGPRPALAGPAPRRRAGLPGALPERNGETRRGTRAQRTSQRPQRRHVCSSSFDGVIYCQPTVQQAVRRHLKAPAVGEVPADDVLFRRPPEWEDPRVPVHASENEHLAQESGCPAPPRPTKGPRLRPSFSSATGLLVHRCVDWMTDDGEMVALD